MRDPLDRDYTPDELAISCLGVLRWSPDVVIEPSVGRGAFALAARARWPGVPVYGVDLDATSPGFALCDAVQVGDWLTAPMPTGLACVVGNPPYNQAEEHVRHALSVCDHVAFVLRLGFLAGQKRAAFWREFPPAEVHVLSRRPSFRGGPTDATDYGWFVWSDRPAGPIQLPTLSWLSW